jgi:hypothetical protein
MTQAVLAERWDKIFFTGGAFVGKVIAIWMLCKWSFTLALPFHLESNVFQLTEILYSLFLSLLPVCTRHAQMVAEAAARHLTPVTLELGGKSPCIVDRSASDLKVAAMRACWGALMNAGEGVCVSLCQFV